MGNFNWEKVESLNKINGGNQIKERGEYEGKFTRLFFTSPNYCVGLFEYIKTQDDSDAAPNYFTAVSHFEVETEIPFKIEGTWETNLKYEQRQFTIEYAQKSNNLNKDGLYQFLVNHPEIKNIGPVRAQLIVDYCGDNFNHVMEYDIAGLIAKTKIGPDIIDNLVSIWKNSKLFNQIIIELSEMGFSFNQCVKIYRNYGDMCVDIVKKNPYDIIGKIDRLGFIAVDKVAMGLDFDMRHPDRIKAGIEYILMIEIRGNGHCWLPKSDVYRDSAKLLCIDPIAISEFLETSPKIFKDLGNGQITMGYLYHYEKTIAEFIMTKGREKTGIELDVDKYSNWTTILNDGQLEAVKRAIGRRFTIITGQAGTGKTFVIKAIHRILDDMGYNVALASPTGKAAKRIEEVVGMEAETIHRLLGYNSVEFLHCSDDPLPHNVVIIDEFSMVDVWLFYHLIDALREDAILICVGDHNQLPPVGPGNPLRDSIIMASEPRFGLDNVILLNQMMRQAGELEKNSVAILGGQLNQTTDVIVDETNNRKQWYVVGRHGVDEYSIREYIVNLVDNIERLGFNPNVDVQVITPMKAGDCGVREINFALQKHIQKKYFGVNAQRPKTENGRPNFYLHDRVIQTANDYGIGVMNGEIGKVIKKTNKLTAIQFDNTKVEFSNADAGLLNIELAYALTIHKTQGSEFPCVIVVLHNRHHIMLHRNLLYTGVTRAKQTVFIVGDAKAMERAVSNVESDNRRTMTPMLSLEYC